MSKQLITASRWAALVAVMLFAGCRRTSVWLERQDSFDVAPAGATRLVSSSHNGHQTLTGQPEAGAVAVRAHVRAGGANPADAQAALDAVSVSAERDGETVKIGWKWNTEQAQHWQANVDFEIDLPANLEVKASTHNGAVTARGLAGPCEFETHNGRVHVETSGPELKAGTHNGAVEATTAAGKVELETHNGSITAKLTAEGDVGGEISTHNGGIVVSLGEKVATALDCTVVNGSIHSGRNLEQSRVKPNELSGSINGGRQTLKIETRNGSIKIQ